jgi:hypothetical protein
VRSAVITVALLLATGVGAAASGTTTIPSAFARSATAADHLPSAYAQRFGNSRPFDSRRIATYTDRKRRHWSVYVFKQAMHNELNICVATLQSGGGGAGCLASPRFFAPGRWVVAIEGDRKFAGVAAANVATVRLIGPHGGVHALRLTRDHGFIYACNGYNGCACRIARVRAFNSAGRLITDQNWFGSNCRRH